MKQTKGPAPQLLHESRQLRQRIIKLTDGLKRIDVGDAGSFGFAAAASQEVAAWKTLTVDTIAILQEIAERAARERDAVDATYGRSLRASIDAAGLDAHGDDSAPIVSGIVYVTIDAARGTVSVNDVRAEDVRISSVVELIREEQARLTSKAERPAEFLEHLRAAYVYEIAARGLPEGNQVESLSLLRGLVMLRQSPAFLKDPRVTGFREYPLALFRADLYRLLKSGECEALGKRLRYGSGASTSGAVFMLDPALGRPAYVARMWFEPDTGR